MKESDKKVEKKVNTLGRWVRRRLDIKNINSSLLDPLGTVALVVILEYKYKMNVGPCVASSRASWNVRLYSPGTIPQGGTQVSATFYIGRAEQKTPCRQTSDTPCGPAG